MESFRADSLSALPAPRYNIIDAPTSTKGNRDKRAREDSQPSPRSNTGARTVVNPDADPHLVKRFKSSGHKNIRDMTKGHEVEIPKQGGQETCMLWACKGECNSACKRFKMHIRYPDHHQCLPHTHGRVWSHEPTGVSCLTPKP